MEKTLNKHTVKMWQDSRGDVHMLFSSGYRVIIPAVWAEADIIEVEEEQDEVDKKST